MMGEGAAGMKEIYEAHPDRLASKVIINMKNGETCSLFVPYPKGDPENEMTMEDIAAKGHGLVDPIIGEKTYDRMKDFVLHLEEVENVGEALKEIF